MKILCWLAILYFCGALALRQYSSALQMLRYANPKGRIPVNRRLSSNRKVCYASRISGESQVRVVTGNETASAVTTARRRMRKLPLPFMNVRSLGLTGNWVRRHDNFLLLPKRAGPPIGVIHFLGGAFVGAAPHLLYNSFLQLLADEGYIIVATPYRLEMDYLSICDGVLAKFERVAVELAQEFGALPVIGIGHSLGAVLQALVTCLFPDTPRAVNILVSFNSKSASSAIPLFQELVIPLSKQLMQLTDVDGTSPGNRIAVASVRRLQKLRQSSEYLLETYAQLPISPLFVGNELLPALLESAELVDQLPPLLKQIADGRTEFTPQYMDLKEVCRRMYRARRTLLVKFNHDNLDESEQIQTVLREANTIMRMKRPMVDMEATLHTLTGSHVTPLVPALSPVLNSRISPLSLVDAESLAQVRSLRALAEEVISFLATGFKASKPLP